MKNGTIAETHEIPIFEQHIRRAHRTYSESEAERFANSRFFGIRYWSEGLLINGFMLLPPMPEEGNLPAILFNRGGAGLRGALTEETAIATLGRFAAWGYAVVASNYRGQGGSQGDEEWGAGDVDDAMNALELLRSQPYIDTDRLGLVAGSRGGMMALMMLRRTRDFRAAAMFGAPTSFLQLEKEEYIRSVLERYLPNIQSEEEYHREAEKRSSVAWANELAPNTPLLLLHGTGDKRVAAEHSLWLALELQKIHHPYKLIMYDNADHVLAGRRDESDADIRYWMDMYVRDKAPLPRTGPHGA